MRRHTLALILALVAAYGTRAMQDRVDLPFVDDPSVVGVWRSVAFVPTPEEFAPGRAPAADLFLKEQAFLPGGRTPVSTRTWTRGALLDPPRLIDALRRREE